MSRPRTRLGQTAKLSHPGRRRLGQGLYHPLSHPRTCSLYHPLSHPRTCPSHRPASGETWTGSRPLAGLLQSGMLPEMLQQLQHLGAIMLLGFSCLSPRPPLTPLPGSWSPGSRFSLLRPATVSGPPSGALALASPSFAPGRSSPIPPCGRTPGSATASPQIRSPARSTPTCPWRPRSSPA